MALTLETVRKVAALANVAFAEEELPKFQAQLSAILEAVEKLSAVDTSGVPPTASVLEVFAPPVEDEPKKKEAAFRDEVFSQAPQRLGDSFAVPRFVE